MKNVEQITKCRACESKQLRPFFDLGEHPPSNSLLDKPNEHEERYPLSLSWCEECNLVQLNHTVNPEILFKEYVWVTGTSRTANEFAYTFCNKLIERTDKKKSGYVLELASNDGTFLVPFMEKGYKVLGIDPAENIAEAANKDGIPTEAIFFTKESAKDIVKKHGKADIIFARNVLPHVAGIRGFVQGIVECMTDNGVVALETHYAKIILEELHYDSIYHEHLCYFTIKSIERILNDHGLYIFDIVKSPISGGSNIVYAKKHKEEESRELKELKQKEIEDGTNNFDNWQVFAKDSYVHRDNLRTIIKEQKKKGAVVGWGASARSSTLLNFMGATVDDISEIIDLNPLKQGKYTAGTHIPIKKMDEVLQKKPASVIILAWNFEEEIKEIMKEKDVYKGAAIVPLPNNPKIIQI